MNHENAANQFGEKAVLIRIWAALYDWCDVGH
jgi:hypothetical protein